MIYNYFLNKINKLKSETKALV